MSKGMEMVFAPQGDAEKQAPSQDETEQQCSQGLTVVAATTRTRRQAETEEQRTTLFNLREWVPSVMGNQSPYL